MAIDRRRSSRGRAERFVVNFRFHAFAALAVLGYAAPATSFAQLVADPAETFGQAWRYGASVELDETWSDNINLAPSGSERSDLVTTITPQLSVTRNGPRLKLTLVYAPEFLYFSRGSDGAQLRNALNANLDATLVENLLFFDASSQISQGNISPFGTLAANTVNGSTNRVESRSYSFGPTLRSRLQQDFTYAAGYRYLETNTDSSSIASSHTSELFANFQSSTSFRDVGIGGNYDRSDQEFSGANSIITEQESGTVTYVLSPTIHLLGSAGYDHNRYPTTGQPDLKGMSYSGGFDWEPSHHTSISAQFGHRYFGPTANVHLSEATPHVSFNASYTRDQTTSSGSGLGLVPNPNYQLLDQFFRASITDPALRAQAVTSVLSQSGLSTSPFSTATFFSNQLFVQKRLDVSLALIGLRNTVTFDANRTESQGLSNLQVGFDIFAQAQNFRSTSYSANWSHKLGPQTTLNATATRVDNQAITGSGNTRQRQLIASVSRTLSRKLSVTALYRNTKQTGTDNNSGFFGGNYHENAVIGSLRVNF